MSPTLRAYAGSGAALFSSVVLLGPFAFGMLVGAGVTLVDVTGVTVPDPLPLVGLVLAVVASLSLAVEGAMVQRHGLAAVDRGGPLQRTWRYFLIGVTLLASLITIGRLLAMVVPRAVEHGSTSTLVLAALIVVAIFGTLFRTIAAARAGYDDANRSRSEIRRE